MRALPSAVRVALLVCALAVHCLVASATAAPLIQGGEVIVKFKAGAPQSAIDAIRADLRATTIHRFERIGVEHDRISGGTNVPDAIARYRYNPAVEFIEPNYIVSIVRTPDDPLFPQLWALRNTGQTGGLPGADISATEAWDTSTGSGDVIVGVIDTGVDYTHPDLAGNIYVNAGEVPNNGIDDDGNGFVDDIHGWDFVNFDSDPMDDNGHGTHVSGTVGAIGNNGIGVAGVSWSVRIMPLKFLNAGGSGTTADAIAAIEYAIPMGVKVLSNSWGGGGYSEALRLAILDANNAGILFVAAAGNASSNNDLFPAYPASYDAPNIISVAATNSFDELAGFSNFGPTSVDLGAPGTDILSTLPSAQYGLLSGTSMATPHVSGALALILARFPSMTASDAKTLLLNAADPLPALSGKVLSGGRLNVAKALEGPDSIAPGPIVDLVALTATSNGVPLQWTATGDDGTSGTVTAYDIRYSSFEITEANFESASRYGATLEPHPPGSQELVVVRGLDFSTTYYFAIKARDEYSNRSPISNVVSATTLGPPDIDVSPSALSAALLTGETVTRTLTLRNQAAGTLDFSLNTLTGPPGSGAGTGGPAPLGIPLVVSGSGLHRWGDYVQSVPTNSIAGPLFAAGPVRTATLPDVITDPSGDGGSVDLTVLRGLGDRGELQIEMELSTPIDRFNFGGYLSLDIDRNRATGFPPSAGNGLQDIGAEYEFQFFSLGSGVVDLYNIVLGSYVGSFPAEIGARTLRFSVPLDLLGHDDGTMDVTGVIGNAIGPTDWFPNSGHGTIQGIQFLSFTPSAGTVPPGGSVDVQVTFDATGLAGGGYDESIRIASNDPDEAEVLVPAHLDVTGAPDIALSSVAVNYGAVFLGLSKPATVVVSNVGTDLLTVTGMTTSPAEFSVDPGGFSLAPGASHEVIVTFAPQSVGAFEGLLTIASNDHDEGSVTVALHGDGLIAPDIALAPSTFAASLTTGETATSVLTVQNTGGSDLTFGIRTRRPPAISGAGGSPVSLPSSLRAPTRNQTQPGVGPPSVRAEYEGTFLRFGITEFGEIMPFQSPVGNEHLAVGAFVSGYTVAYMTGGVDHVCFSVNADRVGIVPVSYREIENTPAKVSVEVVTRTSDGVLGIRRVFTFQRGRKYVAVTTELQNLSPSTVTQVVLKEDTDWDVDNDYDDDGWDYDRARNMVYAWDEHYVAVGADQAPDLMDIYGWNDYASRATTVDIPSGPVRPFDGMEVLHFELGTLGPTQRRPVSLAYAVGSNLAELQQEMDLATGVRWLAVNPETGVVPAGGSAELAVTFDPGNLATGDYAGQIVVESNDPDEAEVALPASLHVTGIPDLALSPESLDFGTPFVGQVVTRTLQVTNLGTGRLEVTSVTPGLSAYAVDTGAFAVDPFQTHALSVTFSPTSAGLQNSILTIVSDDPDEGSVTVALHGEGLLAPVIGVTPASLNAALLTGESTSQQLTIRNTGGSDLQFTVAKQAAAFAAAAAASLRTNGHGPAPVSLASMTPMKSGITGSFASTAVPNALAAANRVLVAQDSIPTGSDILVIANTSIDQSVLRALGELGHGYDLVYAEDFTGIDFTPYRTIVVVLDGGAINEASCQALANAAAGGRLLFMLGGTTYPPYYNGVQTYLLSHTGEADWVQSAPPHLSVVDASDPLAHGLPASYTFSDATLPYYMLRINDPAARVAVENGDHHPALVHKSLGAGTLVYYINPGDDYFWGNPSDYAILKQIVQNALTFGGASWLSVEPNSGTVAPGASIDLNVTFNATGLFGGGYDASILVESNDPRATEVLVPAHLDVTGAPDIALSSVAVNYGTVFIGVSSSAKVVVSNVGTDLLTVSGMTASPGDFSVDASGFSLAPGASRDVMVTFSPQSTGAVEGLLTIASNDPDEGSVTVTLHGDGLIAPIIGVTPASLSAALLTGGSTSQQLTIRNTGGSDLQFTVTKQGAAFATAAAASLRTNGHGPTPMALASMTSMKSMTTSFASTAVPDARVGANRVLVPQDSIPTGSDILVIANAPIDQSVLRALGELGHGYDLVYANDFTGIDFTPYRTIVVALDGGPINEASCQALASAAAGGRLLFMLGGTNYGPYYNGVQTYLLSHTGEVGWVQSPPPHLSVVDASDPLAHGLPANYTFSEPAASFYMLRINDPAARVAVGNGDHHPALVHKSLGTGTLVYYVNPPDNAFWGNASDYAILKQIIQNALTLSGASWLSVEPNSGTVAPGASIDLNVTFDATGLFGGGYDAAIRVGSNDPHAAEVVVPTHLSVTGVPDIALSGVTLSYGTVFIGVSSSAKVVVSNVGTDLLTVSGMTASPGDFSVDASGFSLAPGASRDVMVTFSPQSAGAIEGLLTIASNDPDEGSVTVTLHGEGLLAPRIAVTPASLRADLLSGESSSQTLTVQNDGGSDLVFAVTLTDFVFPAAAPATTAPGRTASEIMSGYEQYRANPSSSPSSPVRPVPQAGIIPIWQQVQSALSDSFIVFHDDVEGGANGWTHYATDPAGTDQWGISTSRSSSGSRSWRVSQHDGIGADALQSPAIDLSGYVNAMLTFKHWYNFDDCGDPTFEPDGGLVEVSRDGGATWTQIVPLGGYPYVLDNTCGNDLAHLLAYCHDGGDGAAFIPAVFDLTPFVGGPVRIRFHAGWDCGNCNFNEGWYIDDVTVYSRAPRFVTVTPASGTVAAGSSQSLGVDLNSTGLGAGVYSLDLIVASNDPVTPAKTVPTTMHVIGAPFISVTPTSLAFAPLFVGQSSTQTLVVKNTGTEVLAVTGMSSSEGSYSASPTAFNLEPLVSQIVTVTFAPSSVGTKNGTLTMTHNASGSPTSVSLSGSGITPPILTTSPDSIRVSLNPGAVRAENITIGNVGGSDLQFSLDARAGGAPVAVSTDPPLAKGVEDRRVGAPVVLRSGGPDLFGHRWIDSDSPGGPVFNWLNIVPVGTQIPLTGDDATSAPIPIGFPFHYFGAEFTTVRVSTNGYLSFTSALASFSNQPLPSTAAPENLLAVFWDDLYFDPFSYAFYYYDGGRFIVQFENVHRIGGGGPYTFEVILYPSGNIVYQYLSMSSQLTSATIGFQNAAQNDGLTVVFDNNYVRNNLAVRIETGLPWLTLNPRDGTIPAGATMDVRAFLNTADQSQGDHRGVIDVYTNDPAASIRSIPVTLHVNGDDPPIVSAPATASGAEGLPLTLHVTASDPEGDRMYSLEAAPLPRGATFVANDEKSAGDLHWTPDYDQAGTFTVTISATSARHADPVSGPIDPLEGSTTVQIAIANTDRAPVVTAPAAQTVAEGVLLTFAVSAADPDGEPVATLEVGEIPVGATYTPDPVQPKGTFAWTPTFANAGNYSVTFTASNALVGSATTAITVTNQNRAPVANAGGPYVGMPGVPIAFDGTKSSDPDGQTLEFAWNFGDGNLGSGPSPMHAYASTAGSPFTVTLSVSDGSLSATAVTTATIQGTFAANVFFPFNLDYFFPQILPGWVLVEPVGNSFAITDVLLSTITMSYNGSSIPAMCKTIVDHDRNHNGIAEIRVCFTRNDLKALFASLPNGTSNVIVKLEGGLVGGGTFQGTTPVHVVKLSFLGAGTLASVSPNPLNPQAKLTFVTTQPGLASVQVFDLNGRLVRNLMAEQSLSPGIHEVTVDGRNEQGNRLASGVYYYRVRSIDGITKGTFVMLK